jgi:predicted DsbA family dithiol-disulfide isomerase
MYDMLRKRGSEFGLKFGELEFLSNSHKSLLSAEYARDMGKADKFSQFMFEAYFSDCKDIGDIKVIDEVAKKCELDIEGMHFALERGIYEDRLYEYSKEARAYTINSVPTFIINDKYEIVGAQDVEEFKNILRKIQ